MKFKLINRTTNEETLCDKVTVDGFDYYVSKEIAKEFEYSFTAFDKLIKVDLNKVILYKDGCPKVIATNNFSMDIPRVEDDILQTSKNYILSKFKSNTDIEQLNCYQHIETYLEGYNKSQETHPFSEEDIIEFGEWCENLQKDNKDIRRTNPSISRKELFEIWRSQHVKTIYYE